MTDSRMKQNRILKTDFALKIFNKTHQDNTIDLREPTFSDYYKLSAQQKLAEIIFVGVSALEIGLAASHFL